MDDKWEYRILTMAPGNDPDAARRLNEHGKDGWELVAVSVQFTSHFVWLKRKAP